ncbi:hypothetical protein ZIOFF_065023 [Zingiber officinale]|uniref:DUF7903 domain-containing protein n=1 Tax=Zingiber officinale TaxID=94328 RepID=A0A8J5EWM8_ZINOF|nr:hypothetical protein ZIOFF_065023 [Zingiber officinale]
MAYIPPHKRHSATGNTSAPAPPPASLSRRFGQSLVLDGPSHPRGRKPPSHQRIDKIDIAYAAQSASLWCIAGGCPHPDDFRLEPYPCDVVERQQGYRPLMLTIAGDPHSVESEDEPPPWATIVTRIERDLLSSLIRARSELAPRIKISFVARIGRVSFLGREPSSCLESVRRAAYSESDTRGKVRMFFNTNLQNEHVQEFEQSEMAKLGFDLYSQKECYIIKFNKTLGGSVITCKCKVAEGGGLEIYKIEQNRLRHLVVDVSCVSKDHDLRLMLYSMEVSKTLDDAGIDVIKRLISDAIIDPNAKGGLRWSLGKDSVDGTCSITKVWHVKCKNFKSQNMRINFRYADRFRHKISLGEVANEVVFKFPGVSKQLSGDNFEPSSVSAAVQDAVKLIWNHFLGKNVGVEGEKCKEK